jgi:hypothetical protein
VTRSWPDRPFAAKRASLDAGALAAALQEQHVPPAGVQLAQPFPNLRLPAFSAKSPAWSVQKPASSEARITCASRAEPRPRPRLDAATYTLTSATPP